MNNYELIDIGVNLSNNRFKDDLDDVIARAYEASVTKMVLTGTSESESLEVIEICKKYNQLYPDMLTATVGIHPHYANEFNSNCLQQLDSLAKQPEVVAIGETGLDFNRNFSTPSNQITAFEAQLELASKLEMPLFMHERDAANKQLEIVKAYRDDFSKGVIHCFTGDRKTLFSYLDLDLHIGITGWVCDPKRGLELQKIVSNIPLDRLMIETDAPYLFPKNINPAPKNKRNEPAFLTEVLRGIAEVRDESMEDLAKATTETAKKFFAV